LNEQILWNQVVKNPKSGKNLDDANNDPRFPISNGWQKLKANHTLPDGKKVEIHYQYNSKTDKAYDIKITSEQQVPPQLQPGPTIN